jgi:hypothetical protein
MINDGTDRFNIRDDRDTVVARSVSLVDAIELVHQDCRLCDAGENHTHDAVRSDRRDPRASVPPSPTGTRALDPMFGNPPHRDARRCVIDIADALDPLDRRVRGHGER